MENIHVLEFGSYLAGPLLGKHLCRFGCHVTSIKRPESARGAADERAWSLEMEHDLHTGKHRIELDLPREIDYAMNLIRTSHVLIENFATGTMANLGLSVSACLAINPTLIYISLPGYVDAKFADVKAWESVIMSLSGVFCDMGLNRTLLGIEASFSALPMASVYGSIFGCLSVLCAIFSKQSGHIQIPLASALTEALIHNNVHFSLDNCYKNARQRQIESGNYPITPEFLDTLFDPFFSKYICADDRPIYLVCPAHKRHQQIAIRVLGVEKDIYEILTNINPYENQPNFGIGSGNLSREQASLVRPILKKAFAQLESIEWEKRLGEAGVPIIAHRTTKEWLHHAHTKTSGLVENDSNGIRIAPIGWLSDEEKIEFPSTIDDKWPYKKDTESTKSPLKDIRVVDLCNVIAGPSIGTFLARMGADVIKIDPTEPTYAPEIAVIYGIAANIGKRSLLLDIFKPDGRKTLNKLLRHADILIVNCTNEALIRAHLTRSELKLINNRLLLVRFDAWNGPNEKGVFSNFNGYDDNIQAGIGIQERFGGGIEHVEEHAHVGTIDVIAGVAGAATAVCALIAREQGRICTARTSLAAVGQYVQYPFMFREETTIGKGRECRGIHPFYRCARTLNGFIIISTSPCNSIDHIWEVIIEKLNLHTLFQFDKWLESQNMTNACKILQSLGIEAQPLVNSKDLRKQNIIDRPILKNGPTYQFLAVHDHPIGYLEIVAPVAIRMVGLKTNLSHAPKYGENTLEILTKLSCNRAILTKAACVQWSKNYLPFGAECIKCKNRGNRVVIMECSHSLCYNCLSQNKIARACPICKIPHELDIFRLRSITNKWKTAYNLWRQGFSRGSRDMERIFQPSTIHVRSRSAPPLRISFQSTDSTSTSLLDSFDKRD